MINFNSVREIQDLLKDNNLSPNKNFGQNFLFNQQAREYLLEVLDLNEDTTIWEIGPGIGTFSYDIAKKVKSFYLFEIDNGYIKLLKENLIRTYPHASLIEGDFLKTSREMFRANSPPDIVFGNLPYNVSSTIIESFIEQDFLPQKMVFTIQKELAQRLTAEANNKNYSYLSIVCQFDYEIKVLKTISKHCFYPIPNVESSVITMTLREPNNNLNKSDFLNLTRDLFAARRKTILNNLKNGNLIKKYPLETLTNVLEDLQIPPTSRGETLKPIDYIAICEKLYLA